VKRHLRARVSLVAGIFAFAATAAGQSSFVSTLSPAATTAGASTFTLLITGSGFVSGAAVKWTTTAILPPGSTSTFLPVLFVTPTQIGATVSSQLVSFPAVARVTVINPDGPESNPLIFLINQPPIVVSGPQLPAGTLGIFYSQSLLASGGSQPFRWSVTAGLPPPGLILNPSGFLTGTPTTAGAFTFAVTVTDNAGVSSAAKTLSVTINAPSLNIVTASPLPPGAVGTFYSQALSVLAGSLGPGLTLNSGGLITGTPTATGVFNFTVRVIDAAGVSADKAFVLTINPPLLNITTASPLPNGTVGLAYSQTFAVSGGTPGYTWSIAEGLLPGGLTLNSSGQLSGTPAAGGTFSFTVRVMDAAQASATKAFALTVDTQPLSVTAASPLAAGTLGVPYSVTLAATGGTPGYTWSVADGSVPAGLTLGSSGVLSGTPTAAATFNFTVRVVDAAQISAIKVFALTIRPPALSITTTSPLAGGTAGTAYTTNLTAAGGTPPYSWSVITGTLPGGLTLSAAGVIAGTPTVAGPFGFTVQVADSEGMTVTRPFDLVVALEPIPPSSVSGLSDVTNPAEQPKVSVNLESGYPLPLTGTLTLSFAPDAEVPVDDPAVQFATGGRSATFTIGANQTQVPEIAIQTGSIAGTITVTLQLTAAGQDVTPSPAPTSVTRIVRLPPSITSVQVTRTGTGFNVLVTGISTPRQVTQATFRFTAAAGANLQTSEVTMPVSDVFTTWYRSEVSAPFGSAFLYTQPFTVQGDTNAIASVTVTLTNSQGTSQPSSANF
jgi:hypothetical protein